MWGYERQVGANMLYKLGELFLWESRAREGEDVGHTAKTGVT